jgi:nucleoside-diphosphate-sugar epimerase
MFDDVQPAPLIQDDTAAIRVVHLEQHAGFGHRCDKSPAAVVPRRPADAQRARLNVILTRGLGQIGRQPMKATGDYVVIGAAGGTGSAVVSELASRGLRVRAVTRSGRGDEPGGVEQMAADVGTADGARLACEGAAVVYHCAQPPYTKWAELFPPMTQAILDGAAAAGAKLVFADNLYVYGPPDGPMTEETPQRAQGKKGRIRVKMADTVLGAHADGRLRVTIGRSSDYYGPRGTTSTVGDNIMKPVLRGKRARWLGSLDQPHTLNYLEDMARALVALGERDEADGQVWHLPAAEPLTGRQFLELVFKEAGHPPKVGVASRSMIRIGGLFNPLLRELNETLYQFERPFVSDASKFEHAFGPFEPTSHRAAVRRTVDWFRRRDGV